MNSNGIKTPPPPHRFVAPICVHFLNPRPISPHRFCALLAGAFAAGSLWAQAPQTTPAPSRGAEPEQTVELSPFVVTVSQDTGYVAQDTLAGTRTRTSLKDVPSAISVFTADLISDLGATNEKDVMAYSASAVPEVDDQSLNIRGNGIGGAGFQFRIRGQAATRSRNYFDALAPSDTYNIGRFEEARGPNAILFGMGGAGGILNQTTKRANLSRQQTFLAATYGSDNYIRGELDHNQIVVPGKIALRLNALAEDSDGYRPYEFDRQQRGHLAATAQLASAVKLHVDLEYGSSHNNASRNFSAADQLSVWLDNGRPTRPGGAANAPLGIAQTANQQRVTVVSNDGSARNFQQTLVSTTDVGRRGAVLVDNSFVPHDAFLPGPGSERFYDFNSQTVFLELQPARNLFVELAADWQSSADKRYDYSGQSIDLFGEPSTVYRDGTTNPYAGNLYFERNWILKNQDEKRRTYRATAAYTLDRGKWGKHNLTVMAQDNRADHFQHNYAAAILGAPFNATPSQARNLVTVRSYITNPNDVSQYAVGSWRNIPPQISVVMNPGAAPSAFDTGWVVNGANGLGQSREVLRSYLASTQSYFFKDRLVASLGFRRDERTATSRPTLLDPTVGDFVIDYSKVEQRKDVASQASLGLVYHANSWLSLLYNQSKNAEAGGAGRLIPDASVTPLSRGKGQDIGFMLSLLEKKLFVRMAYYETSSIDEAKPFGATINTGDRNNRILDTMVTDGVLSASQADQRRFAGGSMQNDLIDRESTGYELNITANPTANWRLIINASQGDSVESNMLKRTKSVRDGLLALWATARQTSITTGTTTVAQEIADFNTWYASNTAIEGEGSLGAREWQVKFFNRYNFSEGFLKGWNVGGGWRYQSTPIIGANAAAGIFYKGESTTEVDLFFGYDTRLSWFGHRTRLSFQVNGNDLLQRRDYLSVRRDPNGILSTVRFVEPANYKLQVKLSF